MLTLGHLEYRSLHWTPTSESSQYDRRKPEEVYHFRKALP